MRRSLRRMRALLVREMRHTVRTRGSLAILLAGPALLLLLFGYSVSLDIERVPIAIVLEQPTPEARDLAGAFNNAKYFRPVVFLSRHAAERALARGKVYGILVLADDFARAMLGGEQVPVQLIVDGVDPRVSRIVISYTESAVAGWLAQRLPAGAAGLVGVKPRIFFNEEAESLYFMGPGLIALLMTVTGPFLTALLILRERARGSTEALLATPMTAGEFVLAKLGWSLILGVSSVMLMLALAIFVMGVPFRGSLWPIVLAASLFTLCVLAFGAIISMVAATQAGTTQLTLTTGYLPAYMLSGILFDLRNAPVPVQWISEMVPARHLSAVLHTVMLAGNVWGAIWPHVAALALIAVALLACATALVRKRLS